MKITIAGKDVTEELDSILTEKARKREGPEFLSMTHRELSAVSLADTTSEENYLDRLLEVLRGRYEIGIPIRIKTRNKWIRWLKLKVLRRMAFQHDIIVQQQNSFNGGIIQAIQYERTLHKEKLRQLEREVQLLRQTMDRSSGEWRKS
jgi:hypothetical protein